MNGEIPANNVKAKEKKKPSKELQKYQLCPCLQSCLDLKLKPLNQEIYHGHYTYSK